MTSKDSTDGGLGRRVVSRVAAAFRWGVKGGVRRLLLVLLVALVASFAALLSYAYRAPSVAPELTLNRVQELASSGQVRFAKLLDEQALVVGQRCIGAPGAETGGGGATSASRAPCKPPLKPFQTAYPASDVATAQLIAELSSSGAEVQIDRQTPIALAKVLTTYVYPVLFLAMVFGLIFMAKSGDSSVSEIAGFGSFRKQGRGGREATSKGGAGRVTFADVGGAEEAVVELREVTDYLRDPAKFAAYGAVAPKGVLLFGPPGCGKTLMARAVAGEAGVPFFAVSGAEFIESLVGVGAARVRDLFAQVRQVAPAIVFIDEIDAVGRKRGGEGGGGGEREQTINQLLVELDGFDVSAGIVLMGATNRPDILDPALLRPGRFDRHVTLEPPDFAGREEILRMHAAGKPLGDDVDFSLLAKRTPGFTGADLANVINEAALLAIRQGDGVRVGMAHMAEAIERVLHGPRRRGKLMSDDERRRLAYHESGHALVAAALGHAGGVQRVSILARGRSLGSSMIAHDLSERMLLTAADLRASMTMAMGGAAAERVVFDDQSTTAEDDLDKANAIAQEMVGIHGMSAEVGPRRVLRAEEGFLGSEVRLVETISGQTLGAFDAAVRTRIDEAQQAAARIIAANRHHLDALAQALEEHESLEGPVLEALLARVPVGLAGAEAASGNGHRDVAVRRSSGARRS